MVIYCLGSGESKYGIEVLEIEANVASDIPEETLHQGALQAEPYFIAVLDRLWYGGQRLNMNRKR